MKNKFMWLLVIVMTITTTISAQNVVLALESDTMKILATDGKVLIKSDSSIFAKIDEDILKLKSKQAPALEIKVKKYTLAKNSTFEKMFESLGKIPVSVFTENQIVEIAKNYSYDLRQNTFNFFLFMANNDYYVANISSYVNDSLQIRCYRLSQGGEYYAGSKTCVYIPAN